MVIFYIYNSENMANYIYLHYTLQIAELMNGVFLYSHPNF